VKSPARAIACYNLRLQRPIPCRLRDFDEPVEQSGADALPASIPTYVYADLSDAGSASRVWNRRESRPSDYCTIACASNKPAEQQMPRIPNLPSGRVQHESRQARGKTFPVDLPHLFPVISSHVVDRESHPLASYTRNSSILIMST